MDVIVDGERNFEVKGQPDDMLAVLGAISDFLREKQRSILTVKLDDRTITPEKILKEFQELSPEEVRILEIGSESVSVLVEESLKEIQEILPELPAACMSLARIFQSDTPEDGFEPFNELANIWSVLKTREILIANALEIDLNEFLLEGKPVGEIHEELNSHLEEAVQALQNNDCVLLGDLLEYELAPRAGQEADIVVLLQEQALTRSD